MPINAFAKSDGDAILGQWYTGVRDSKVEIYRTGDTYSGKISWLKQPKKDGKLKIDDKNPDKSKSNRPIMGLALLKNFKYSGNNKWESGKIYDPRDGKEYSCNMTLANSNTLNVRGYIGFSFIGKTDVWTRK
ncbi:MAG: DUF2147 domain-containing protein [Candidatus Sericytochromatia bacterium]|nr:DUF2147 domain-containing protein [Candidatus Sericytochromatia bacterium]